MTVTLIVSKPDTTPPTLNISGFTANSVSMTLAAGAYILNTDGNVNTHYQVQFAPGSSASENLSGEDVGLYLIPTAGQTSNLQTYYLTKPAPYQAYLNAAAAGTAPFAYIKTDGTTTIQILDGAQKYLASTESDMIIPGDYPAGDYTVSGIIHDTAGNPTTVTYTLKVVPPDTTPPSVTSVVTDETLKTITYNFDEAVQLMNADKTAIINSSAYATSFKIYDAVAYLAHNFGDPEPATATGVSITQAILAGDSKSITITYT